MKDQQQYQEYLYYIIKQTEKYNLDNVARTKAYQRYYIKHPEIKWALVASVVSRNAGWNMTDLFLPPFKQMLNKKERQQLFMTYERANWLIFSDAYPQLLLYELSKQVSIPWEALLKELRVSSFMMKEWNHFIKTNDEKRLMTALIINEQNVIQHPVIMQPYFKRQIFLKAPYLLQNYLMLNAVLLPTYDGKLYGSFVHGFTNVTNRITLGKNLASQIFHPKIHHRLIQFLFQVEHTGSRRDYEHLLSINLPKSPMLRLLYPIVDHQDIIRNDWYKLGGIKKKWNSCQRIELEEIGAAFYRKRNLLFAYHYVKNAINKVDD